MVSPRVVSRSRLRDALDSRFRGELFEARAQNPVEGWEWMNDVGERVQRRAQLDREHELAHDLARTWSDQRGADEHAVFAVADELQSAAVKVVNVPSGGLGRIGVPDDDIDTPGAR